MTETPEPPWSLDALEIVDEINAYHRVIGSPPLKSYMPWTQEEAIEHWRQNIWSKRHD